MTKRIFHYVDFAARYQKGFRNHVVLIEEVADLVASFKNYGCYATYYFYSDEILTYLATQETEEQPSVSGYKGKVWAPYFPIDIDCLDLKKAQESARFFIHLFLDEWGLEEKALQSYFSGQKGFHLLLDSHIFGIVQPSNTLPLVFAALRQHLAWKLPIDLRDTVDLSIKDRVRLLRLPNTIHEKSKFFKVPLSSKEIMTLSEKSIRKLAKNKRLLKDTDPTGFLPRSKVKTNASASRLYERVRLQVKHLIGKPVFYKFSRPRDPSKLHFPCRGIQKIWENKIESGYRNNCAIRLASELRLLGFNVTETREKLLEWNNKNKIRLPLAELEGVAQSAFSHRFPYHFSCHDEILRHFCPLKTYEACQKNLAEFEKNASY